MTKLSDDRTETVSGSRIIVDMAVVSIYLILFCGAITRCRCDHTTTYINNVNGASQFGELLKPPPPPLLQLMPVPFHGGAGRPQRQNVDAGYNYQPPPPPPPPLPHTQVPLGSDFKFPAPFYKQYNFNFVPPPQPFTTEPPSLFQKVSTWLFPSQQTNYDTNAALSAGNIPPIKKDCNPCNLVPWIPVIRYNLGAKNMYQTSNPTYGPPSPTAQVQNIAQFRPQPFLQKNQEQKIPHLFPGVPHAVYGPPAQHFSSSTGAVSATYGPPSPTHTIGFPSQSPLTSTFSAPSFSPISSSTYGAPSGVPSSTYGAPSSSNRQQSSSYLPSPSQSISVTPYYDIPTSTYRPQKLLYTTPIASQDVFLPATTYAPVTSNFGPGNINDDLLRNNDVNFLYNFEPTREQRLPKVSQPTEFRNSYGEIISNNFAFDSAYPVSATAAESTKIKTEVLPNDFGRTAISNMSLALANPAPFTSNRGRNIHTLQPVALPNLSVSPLPPIFNARPFRPVQAPLPTNILLGINQMQKKPNNVDISESVPIVEFAHSIDYPASFVQSPVIDIEALKINNQTKAYRNIVNHYVIDEIRDISSQASEDHATKTISDSSFESTGSDIENDIYDMPKDLKQNYNVPSNHKPNFADLRGYKDEDVDKYRTESNLQHIDSPLLYLKPNAPHKSFGNFVLAVSTPVNENDYEIYDDIPSTGSPQAPTLISGWDESRNDYGQTLSPPQVQTNTYQSKIVQIIVPYTTGNKESYENSGQEQDYSSTLEEEHQARKVPSNTESTYPLLTEGYSTLATTTEELEQPVTESYDSERANTGAILNDLYDVKEPPFDIIKLQHTIDDWTEQEYSRHKPPQKTRTSEKYAKKIPDEYFTTTLPTNYVTEASNHYDIYDHEGSSSIQHIVTENDTTQKPRKEYNTIERTKSRITSGKNEELDDIQKLHIYTAASSFRTTTTSTARTTTAAPWGKIQTSISPLTKEKVYVVTSKPWREQMNATKEWYEVESFESRKTKKEADNAPLKNMAAKSPRFMNRPSFGFTSGGKIESIEMNSPYGFSRSWYQSINELETKNNHTSIRVDSQQPVTTNSEEGTMITNRHKYK